LVQLRRILLACGLQVGVALPVFAAFSYVLWLFGDASSQRYAAPMFVTLSGGLFSGMDWATGPTMPTSEGAAIGLALRDGGLNAGFVVVWVNVLLFAALGSERVLRKWRGKSLVERDVTKFLLSGGLSVIAGLLCSCVVAWFWCFLGLEGWLSRLQNDVMDAARVAMIAWIIWACLEGVLPAGEGRALRDGECTLCGYARGGLKVCPECGMAKLAGRDAATRLPRSRASRLVLWLLPPLVLAGLTFPWWFDRVYGSMPFMLQSEVSDLLTQVPRWKP